MERYKYDVATSMTNLENLHRNYGKKWHLAVEKAMCKFNKETQNVKNNKARFIKETQGKYGGHTRIIEGVVTDVDLVGDGNMVRAMIPLNDGCFCPIFRKDFLSDKIQKYDDICVIDNGMSTTYAIGKVEKDGSVKNIYQNPVSAEFATFAKFEKEKEKER